MSKYINHNNSKVGSSIINDYFDDYETATTPTDAFEAMKLHRSKPIIDKNVYCRVIYVNDVTGFEEHITFASRAKNFYMDLYVGNDIVELQCEPNTMSGRQMIAFIWSYLSNRKTNTELPDILCDLVVNLTVPQILELAESVTYVLADKHILDTVLHDLHALLPKRFVEIMTSKTGYVASTDDYGVYDRDIDEYLVSIWSFGDETPATHILQQIIMDTFNRNYGMYHEIWPHH